MNSPPSSYSGQFSEHLQPEILHHHMAILPTIFQALDDPTITVQGTCCYVLEMFCENLQPETLRPFLGPLMQKVIILAQAPQKAIREMAMCTIAATAVAAEADFIPFAQVHTFGVFFIYNCIWCLFICRSIYLLINKLN